jgi:hypothetical protein
MCLAHTKTVEMNGPGINTLLAAIKNHTNVNVNAPVNPAFQIECFSWKGFTTAHTFEDAP